MLSALIVPVLLVFSVSLGSATEAATAPLLGTEITSGRVRCLAVNVDSKPMQLTRMEMLSTNGQVLQALEAPALVDPGQIGLTDFADLAWENPAYCRFVYQGKFRASPMYYNGTEIEVIPATVR